MLKKYYSIVILIFLSLVFSVSFLATRIYASEPVPEFKIPCQEEDNPNFHSLRPYQAAPCGTGAEPKAYYCTNAITVIEPVPNHETSKEPGPKDVNIFMKEKEYGVTISETQLPIYGNTELVKNYENTTDSIDDATKLNEYLSWYLSGVNNKAEYAGVTADQLINFSGPTQKLLPSMIQEAQRIETIKSSYTKTVGDKEVDFEDLADNPGNHGTDNHNDVVVCEEGGVAVPCQGENTVNKQLKLKDWHNPLGGFNTAYNFFLGLIDALPDWAKGASGILLQNIAGEAWNLRTPPLPWADKNGVPFKSAVLYQKAYNEWKGKQCLILPIVGLKCIDAHFGPIQLVNNKWANLYQYVPLSNNSDINAKIEVEGIQIEGVNGAEIGDHSYKISKQPVNWFPHTIGDSQNINSLSMTYTPKVCKDGVCKPLKGEIDYDTVESGKENGKCSVLDVRSNPGDQLFTDKSELRFKVSSYYVTQLMCDEPITGCHTGPAGEEICPDEPIYKCHGAVRISVRSMLKNPFAEEIWNQSTAGSTSVFRKMFPKVEEGAPVECIANIPGVSKAVYKLDAEGFGQDDLTIHDPAIDRNVPNTDARLYFPYIGSVYEYFLKGIQTALRPKGFGEPLVNGQLCQNVKNDDCVVDTPDSAVDGAFLGEFKTRFIDLANRWTTNCPGPQNNLAEKCYNYVASEAKKAGVNPAFALTIWLNESGASNYCYGGESTQDMGINLPDLYKDLAGQLKVFNTMAKTKLCEGTSGFKEPMNGWLSRFKSFNGTCDPNYQCGTAYTYGGSCTDSDGNTLNMDAGVIGTWQFVTGGCTNNGKFSIEWPTDMSCPGQFGNRR